MGREAKHKLLFHLINQGKTNKLNSNKLILRNEKEDKRTKPYRHRQPHDGSQKKAGRGY